MAAARDERARRERIRESIRAFYDVEQGTPPPAVEAAAGTTRKTDVASSNNTTGGANQPSATAGGELDIDSANFNAVKYTTQLLKHQTLPRLVEADNGLRRQVRALDSELQTLVYSNYSKFLTAADTIRQVRSNVDDMDRRLEDLTGSVAAMDRVSRSLSEDLETHRTNIEEVVAVNGVLRKVQFLVRLPEVLKRAVSTGRLLEAAKYWVAGDTVLAKYHHIAAFRRTHEAARLGAEEVYVRLSARVVDALLHVSGSSGNKANNNSSSGRSSRSTSPSTTAINAAATAAQQQQKAPIKSAVQAYQQRSQSQQRGEQQQLQQQQNDAAQKKLEEVVPPLTLDELTAHVEGLRLLAASSINLDRVRAQGAMAPTSKQAADLTKAMYDFVAEKANDIFGDAVASAGESLQDDLRHRLADVRAVCNGPHGLAEIAAEAVVALEKPSALRDVANTVHTAAVALRASLDQVTAVIGGRDSLGGIDTAAAALSTAHPALEALVDTFEKSLVATATGAMQSLAAAFARRCPASFAADEKDSTGSNAAVALLGLSPAAMRGTAHAVQAHFTGACRDFVVGISVVARECLRTRREDKSAEFTEYATAAVDRALRAVLAVATKASDPLQASAVSLGASATESVKASSGQTAALCLFHSAVVGVFASVGLKALEQDKIWTAPPQKSSSGAGAGDSLRNEFDDARRRCVYAAVGFGGAAVHEACVYELTDLLLGGGSTMAAPATAALSGFGGALTRSLELVAHVVTLFVPPSADSSSSSKHVRRGSESAYSRGSGDGGGSSSYVAATSSRGGAAAAGGRATTSRSTTGGGGGALEGSSSGAASGAAAHVRPAQFQRRDVGAAFTSDVDRLFARPTGNSNALRPSAIDIAHVVESTVCQAFARLVDYMRLTSIAADGGPRRFQQLQIDLAYATGLLGANASIWLRKPARVHVLIDELLMTAYERSAGDRVALPADGVTAAASKCAAHRRHTVASASALANGDDSIPTPKAASSGGGQQSQQQQQSGSKPPLAAPASGTGTRSGKP